MTRRIAGVFITVGVIAACVFTWIAAFQEPAAAIVAFLVTGVMLLSFDMLRDEWQHR